ncbi:MAG: DUF1294 domain-containing protein [Turicibacter sp.]
MVLAIGFIIWNVYSCYLMYSDKQKSIKKKWRISEKTLLCTAFCFGGVGMWCGMLAFRHKTKHWYFKLFVPLFAILQVIYLIMIFSF